MLRPSRKETVTLGLPRSTGPRQRGRRPINSPSSSPPKIFSPPAQVRGNPNLGTRQCYRCGELGHISWQCEKPDEPMPTEESVSGPQPQGPSVPVVCVHGDTHEYPTTTVKLKTTKGSFDVEVEVLKTLPVPVLIGLDCPAFTLLWTDAQKRRTRDPRKRKGPKTDISTSWVNHAKAYSSSPGPAQAFIADSSGTETAPEGSPEAELPSWPSEEEAATPKETAPLKGQYGTAQFGTQPW
ncbi:uncharacterized protein LOC115378666 [Xyrichtys novacula]|uniref:Uncharacterized protein LOC115378666 n=1 Tax=Xyrichtys novacula TaxID=13765 RepID=A0AAV1GDT2_XYRNO|nr:uncharacterized protein LOC115378666 [Xyrichtys novacula]